MSPIISRNQADHVRELLEDQLLALNRVLEANEVLRRRVASLERENAELRRQLGTSGGKSQ